jgi:hypothetical protein
MFPSYRIIFTSIGISLAFFMKGLLKSEKLVPVTDACHPLSETAEALCYFEKVHPLPGE